MIHLIAGTETYLLDTRGMALLFITTASETARTTTHAAAPKPPWN